MIQNNLCSLYSTLKYYSMFLEKSELPYKYMYMYVLERHNKRWVIVGDVCTYQ